MRLTKRTTEYIEKRINNIYIPHIEKHIEKLKNYNKQVKEEAKEFSEDIFRMFSASVKIKAEAFVKKHKNYSLGLGRYNFGGDSFCLEPSDDPAEEFLYWLKRDARVLVPVLNDPENLKEKVHQINKEKEDCIEKALIEVEFLKSSKELEEYLHNIEVFVNAHFS